MFAAKVECYVVILAREEWRYPTTTVKLFSFSSCTVGEFSVSFAVVLV